MTRWQVQPSGRIAALLGMAAVVIVTAASSRGTPSLPTRGGVEQASIRDTVLVCPGASNDKTVETSLDLLAPALPAGASQPTETAPAHARILSDEPTPAVLRLSARGQLVSKRLPPAGFGSGGIHSVVVHAVGPLAAGLQGWQLSSAPSGGDKGLAVGRCLSPADQWWFVGTGTKFGHIGKLVLTNADSGACSLNLSLFGAKEKLSAVGLNGISLGPHSTKVLDLAQFAPQEANLALSVTTTQGRVYAAVKDRWTSGLTPTGVDWPTATAPSTDLVVPAILKGSEANRLVIANPGGSHALVSVELLGKSGPFVPKGLASLQLDPGQTITRDVTKLAGHDAASVHLASDQPVLGAVVTRLNGPDHDSSVLGGVASLTGPASVPLAGSGELHLLLASASSRGGGSATVSVMTTRGMQLAASDVSLEGGTTAQWELPHLTKHQRARAAYLVIHPTGSIVAAAFYQRARGALAGVPVESPTFTVAQPTAHLVLTGD
jgi:hypothetical protein